MKTKILCIFNIIIGFVQIIYFLLQNGIIKINSFIIDNSYTESFSRFMNVFMLILTISILILLIFTIISNIKRKKANLNTTGNTLIICGHIISLAGFIFMGIATIFSPLCIIGGFLLLKSN